MDPAPRRPGLRLRDALAMNEPSDPSGTTQSVPGLERLRRRPGIRRRFVVAIGLLVALVLLAQAAALYLIGSRYLVEEIENRARAYGELAAEPICDAYVTYFASGQSKFQQLVLDVANLNPDLDQLAIYDIDMNELWHSAGHERREATPPEAAPPLTLDRHRLAQAVRGLETTAWREGERQGDGRFLLVVPYVEEWGRHQYSVLFSFHYGSLQHALARLFLWVFLIGLFSLLLGLFFAGMLSRQSLRPVEQLIRGARELARGKLEHRIDLHSGDELEALGATLDHMAGLLSRTIADLEASNDRLDRMNRELQQLDKVKSDLLANVSHELRTPLTAISGYSEALHAGLLGPLQAAQQDAMAVALRNIARLRGMIDQLLSFSRIESGRLEVDLRAFDLEPAARLVVEAVGAALGRGHRLVFEAPEDLPEVYGDPGKISQVLENLLTNAVKFSPPGSRVELSLRQAGQGIEVAVSDHGIGIAAEVQPKIFDRFYQVDASSKRQFGGMGLGLAIVKEILDLHHSKIEVESRPGEGATFRFSLPIAAEKTSFVPTASAPRIVWVDDDAAFVQRASAVLAREGCFVQTAATAEQGLRLIQKLRPDLVVLDRILPDGDGFDLIPKLKEDRRLAAVKVVFCTVRKERNLGLRLGAADYWTKPLDNESLVDKVKALLPGRLGLAVASHNG
jgi:signal transduction histidine kinase/ActR/RegA family two-component response regulator